MTSFSVTGQLNPATGLLDPLYDASQFYQLNGSGFGSKNNEVVFYQDFEGVANNTNIPIGQNAGGTGLVLREGGGSSIINTFSHSGSKSWRQHYTGNQFPKVGVDFANAHRKIVHSCWWRFKTNSMGGVIDWKLARAGLIPGDPYNSTRFDHEYTGLNAPSAYTVNTGVVSDGVTSNVAYAALLKGGSAKFFPQQNTWYFYQMICDAGVLSQNPNYFEIKLNGISQGYFDGSETNDPAKAFINPDRPNAFRGMLTPITGLTNAALDVEMWMDEVYVTTGWNYALMTNTPIWTNYTKLAQLSDKGWGDNAILFDKASKGEFAAGETAYIHVFVDNVVQSTHQITVW